ncbi:MAG: hypothetical protein AABZ53_06210 [Planctomycetota bacterium]
MDRSFLMLAPIAALCVAQHANAQVTILGSQRSTYAAVGGSDFYTDDGDTISTNVPFSSFPSVCGTSQSGAAGCADATQYSQMSADAILAQGSCGASTTTDAPDLEQSFSNSVLVVRFRVDADVRYRLFGSVSSNYAGSSVVLFRAGGSTVHHYYESISTADFDELGTLPPGEYELHAVADASVNPSSPMSSIGANYQAELRFGIPCPADFNADGAVDFFDYDEFVVCFEGTACPPGVSADFDADGTIDFFDYDAFVVAFETPC